MGFDLFMDEYVVMSYSANSSTDFTSEMFHGFSSDLNNRYPNLITPCTPNATTMKNSRPAGLDFGLKVLGFIHHDIKHPIVIHNMSSDVALNSVVCHIFLRN